MFDPSPSPSPRSEMNETGMVGVAKIRAGRSPNFRIIHPRKTSARMTVTPTRMFLRYGDIAPEPRLVVGRLYSQFGGVARVVTASDHGCVSMRILVACVT